jgi:hypothetical protein
MIYLFSGIAMALAGAFWLILAAGCFLLYRRYHLRVLPWLVAYWIVSYAADNVVYLLFHARGLPTTVDPRSDAALAGMAVAILGYLGNLLAMALVIGEIALLGARGQVREVSFGLGLFVRAHQHTRKFGITLLLLALALPLPSIIYYYRH